MSKWLPIFFALLYGAYYLITAILQAQARRQQQERAREAAQMRRDAAMRGAGGGGGDDVLSSIPEEVQPQPIRRGQPIDEMAARRKAQLEQLRGRRGAPGIGTQSPQVRVGSPRPLPGGNARFPVELETMPVDSKRQQEQAIRRQRDAEFQRQKQIKAAREREAKAKSKRQAARVQQADPQSVARAATAAHAAHAAAPAVGESRVRAVAAVSANSAHADQLRSRLKDSHYIRDAIILAEILGPPKSLRQEQVGI